VVTGEQLKQEGMQLALMPESIDDWKQRFRAAAEYLADTGAGFTSEDVIYITGLPTGDIGMNANNAVGAMMNALARKGVIKKTQLRRQSKRPTSHGAELVVWAGTSNIGET